MGLSNGLGICLTSTIATLQKQVDVGRTHEIVYAILNLLLFCLMFAESMWPICLSSYPLGTFLFYVWSHRRYNVWRNAALLGNQHFLKKCSADGQIDKIKCGQVDAAVEYRGIHAGLEEFGVRLHKTF